MANGYICAFPGHRDIYQAPLALAEGGLLEEFITDFYAGAGLRRLSGILGRGWREKLRRRCEPALPDRLVRNLYGTALLGSVRQRIGYSRIETFALIDRRFSIAAAAAARRRKAHLLLYNPYAYEAFNQEYSFPIRKVLFQYHPHPDWERRVLREDVQKFPCATNAYRDEAREDWPEASRVRECECWRKADLILCASTVTKQSLVEAGADEARCRVVPYGNDTPHHAERLEHAPSGPFQALFVGSGYQRKGLHHLLLAWRKASLPSESRLVLVCRRLDTEFERMARQTPGVELHRNASNEELQARYARSSLFVMPSLVEGFGQVYLEALTRGCPVLGTPNTCLPDIGGEGEGIFVVPPGEIEVLKTKLEQLSRLLPGQPGLRPQARACAARFTWPRFRESLRRCLQAEAGR